MTRRRALLGGAVVVVLLLGAAVWWVLVGRAIDGSPSAASVGGVQTVNTAPSPADLAAVTTLLTDLPDSGLTALTPDARAVAQEQDVSEVLPAGTRVEVRPDTWADIGVVATVAVRVTRPGEPAQDYLATLTRRPDGWRLAALLPDAP